MSTIRAFKRRIVGYCITISCWENWRNVKKNEDRKSRGRLFMNYSVKHCLVFVSWFQKPYCGLLYHYQLLRKLKKCKKNEDRKSRGRLFMNYSVYVFQQCLYLQLIMYKAIHIKFSINNELFQGQLIHSKIVCLLRIRLL